MTKISVSEFIASSGKSPYSQWFDNLNALAAAKIATAIYRLSEGNFSNTKGVGSGVFETRIDFGPGYRVYFGKEGESIVILLGGSSKKDQQKAINLARSVWTMYKARKRASIK